MTTAVLTKENQILKDETIDIDKNVGDFIMKIQKEYEHYQLLRKKFEKIYSSTINVYKELKKFEKEALTTSLSISLLETKKKFHGVILYLLSKAGKLKSKIAFDRRKIKNLKKIAKKLEFEIRMAEGYKEIDQENTKLVKESLFAQYKASIT